MLAGFQILGGAIYEAVADPVERVKKVLSLILRSMQIRGSKKSAALNEITFLVSQADLDKNKIIIQSVAEYDDRLLSNQASTPLCKTATSTIEACIPISIACDAVDRSTYSSFSLQR